MTRRTIFSLLAGVGLLASAPSSAHAALTQAYSDTFRGGVVVDGWGGTSTLTTSAAGDLVIRLPRGATVRKAFLVSGVTQYGGGPILPGPAGFPRMVSIGPDVAATRVLEGPPDEVANDPSYTTFVTEVTGKLRAIVGNAVGGELRIPIRERGDVGPEDGDNADQVPKITGHTLIVAYDLPAAPLRNVGIYLGSVGSGELATLNFRNEVANRCPVGDPRAEAFPVSASMAWELDSEFATEWDHLMVAPPNGGETLLSEFLGGSDDGARDVQAQAWTAGTLGASDTGAPLGLKGDSLHGTGDRARLDDELYDVVGIVPDGARSLTFHFDASDTDQGLAALVFQTTAKVAPNDTDGDGVLDAVEGDCTIDSDRDGVPDYLDLDSDNDCLGDGDAREAGVARTNAAAPVGDHCGGATPFCITEGAVGVCRACVADFSAAPGPTVAGACLTAAAPICLTDGPQSGTCSAKAANGDATLNREACVSAATQRASAHTCASAVCDTTDSRCGLVDGTDCQSSAECRATVCASDDRCGQLLGKPCVPSATNDPCRGALTCDPSGICVGGADGGTNDAGPADGGRHDAGDGATTPDAAARDAGDSADAAGDAANASASDETLEGGGCACSIDGTSDVGLGGLAGVVLAVTSWIRRRRRG